MNYRKRLKQKHGTSIAFALVILISVLAGGVVIADNQRQQLVQLLEAVEDQQPEHKIIQLLYDRRVVEPTEAAPTPEAAWNALATKRRPWTVLYLDTYLQASRVINSYFRDNPEAAQALKTMPDKLTADPAPSTSAEATPEAADTTTSPDSNAAKLAPLIRIPWYVVFFGYEQYACIFLAALCLGELFSSRRRLKAEELLARSTKGAVKVPIAGEQLIEVGSAQSVLGDFYRYTARQIFGEPKENGQYSDEQLQKMQRYAWVAMVHSLLEVFGRTGDRLQSLEAASSARETAQVRFDGNFHLEQYLQWAIPSIGFFGTIRGISAAMDAAQVADDLPIVVSYLGIAFYSTLTALVLNLLLMGVRATTLSRADEVFAGLDETLRRDVVPRLMTRLTAPPPGAALQPTEA